MDDGSVHDRVVRWLVVIVGTAIITCAVVGLAVGWSDVGASLLLVVGAFLTVLALFFHRIEGFAFKAGANELRADLSKVVGPVVAEELDTAGIASLVETYTFVHQVLTDETDRVSKVKLQDALVDRVREPAFAKRPEQGAVLQLANSGSAAQRVLALGFLYGDASLQTVEAIEPSVSRPSSGNEQYHGLMLAKSALSHFSEADFEEMKDIVRRRPYAGEDPERDEIATAILAADKRRSA